MKILIFGAGNLLLSDEGFGVHLVRYLEQHYQFPGHVELLDAGTMGMLLNGYLEEADRVYIVDVIETAGQPGELFRFTKSDFMLKRLPVKLSPHQVGVQEMLLVSELRGRCPAEVILLGIIPAALHPGSALSPLLHKRMLELAKALISELRASGLSIISKNDPL